MSGYRIKKKLVREPKMPRIPQTSVAFLSNFNFLNVYQKKLSKISIENQIIQILNKTYF